jgi:NAD(P)-dependent dehydrogenase (short-subunit alcohol dehydrogenase family)
MLKERGGDALVLQADLTEAAEAAHLVEEAKKGWDPGGTGEQRGHSPKKAIPGDHRRVPGRDLATNVKAVFCLSREATKGMSRRGRGCIINASSISGSLGFENRSAYCALKGAVNLLTRAMALELGPMGIRVNAVAPRVMNTGQVVANLTKAGMLEETSR